MRKLLLLIKPALFGMILSAGQCQKSPRNETESNTAAKDSLSNAQLNPGDSLTVYNDTSVQKSVGTDTIKPIRIEHGSDNAAKLDSIKKAKRKGKH